jgi:hypothetical protein
MYSFIYQQVLNLVYKLPEDGTDVTKHAGVVKYLTFKRVCNSNMLFYKVYYLAAAFPELNHAQSMHIQ